MAKELEALKIGIPKLKKLYENSAKKMSQNDILGFDLVFVYLDKALKYLESIENSNPSKAFECLDKINNYLNDVYDYKEIKEEVRNDIDTIKQALQRLETIDNIDSSEALYSVDFLKDDGCIITLMQGKALEIIRQYILKAQEVEEENKRLWNDITTVNKQYTDLMLTYQEQKRVLEIINEKGLPLGERDMILHSKDYEEYTIKFSWANFKNISIQKTQEEFKILKGVLK